MESETRSGPAPLTLPVLVAAAFLTACGGGGEGGGTAPGMAGLGDHTRRPGDTVRLGGERLSVQNSVTFRSGTLRDPNARSAATVAAYLNNVGYDEDEATTYLVPTGPVTLRVHGGTAGEVAMVRRIAADMNRVLPRSHRVSVGTGTLDVSEFGAGSTRDVIDIWITSGRADWPRDLVERHPTALGIGGPLRIWSRIEGHSWKAGRVLLNRNTRDLHPLTIHEILHAYGITGHVSNARFPSSFMDRIPARSTAGSLTTSIDGEALVALTRMMQRRPFRPGAGIKAGQVRPDHFGPWTETVFHIAGTAGPAGFGASWRNGVARSWVLGTKPAGPVSGTLSGSAVWEGALAGFTAAGATVTGDAAIGVDFAAMSGRAEFDRLESWGDGGHPGPRGTGAVWGDGDLGYTLGVSADGLGFRSTGGDPGSVEGAFLGAGHEGVGGTLDHPDLVAAFGAVRE